jgi:hypothetical protein
MEELMAFLVTAADRSGRRSIYGSFNLAKEAFKRAAIVARDGNVHVLISAPDGKLHTPAHFSRLFLSDTERDG